MRRPHVAPRQLEDADEDRAGGDHEHRPPWPPAQAEQTAGDLPDAHGSRGQAPGARAVVDVARDDGAQYLDGPVDGEEEQGGAGHHDPDPGVARELAPAVGKVAEEGAAAGRGDSVDGRLLAGQAAPSSATLPTAG